MRRMRRLRAALTVLAISFVLASQSALAADGDSGPTNPTGFGDLLPAPDLTGGDTRTLFESYSPMVYGLDFESGFRDPLEGVFNGYAHMVMMYIVAITRAAISVGWWLFSFTDIKPLTDTASAAIGSVNTELVGWLLPSALAFGAVAAYAQRRANGSAMGQLIWVFAAGLVATSFAVAPTTWLTGVDGARQIGADAVVGTSTQVLGETVDNPIAWPEPSFSGSERDTLLRKSGDATWRAFAVTPWCVAEFGSVAACERYGKAVLDKGMDGDARRDYIDDEVSKAEGGGDAATVKWAKGDNPFGRIGVLTLGAIAATLFAFLTVSLAFTALMAFVGCMLLLVIGVLFVCLWAVPGRPRQWGMNWFEALVGLVMQSILAMLVFSTTLALVTAVFGLTDTLGWLPVSGLAIAVLIAGFRLRRLFESLSTMMRPGMGSLVMGGMARRGAVGAVRRLMGAVGSRAASPTLTERPRGVGSGSGDPAVERATSVRIFRQAPTAGAIGKVTAAARPAHELGAAQDRRAIGTGSGSGTGTGMSGSGTGRSRDLSVGRTNTAQNGQARTVQSISVAAAPTAGGSSGSNRRRSVVSGSGTTGVAASSAAASQSGAKRARDTSDARRSRTTRESRLSLSTGPSRYEPRTYAPSASLREGPAKAQRDRRRSAAGPQRRFREYSSVVKDGVTVMVPTRR